MLAETQDAIDVLTGGPLDLYPEAVELLDEAYALDLDARDTMERRFRNPLLQQAMALKTRPGRSSWSDPGGNGAAASPAAPKG